jgi:hypothetical protein
MLTCLQKHEYDNFSCEKEVADFYACVNEYQVWNKLVFILKKFLFIYIFNRKQVLLKKQIRKVVVMKIM